MRRCAVLSVLAAGAVVSLCAGAAGQFRAYLDESEKAEVLLDLARRYLDDGRDALAVPLLIDALEVGRDPVLPHTWQGAYLAIRRTVFGLPPEARDMVDRALADDAGAALEAAERGGTTGAYLHVMLDFPGTGASRRAAEHLWATAFERGDLPQTVEHIRAFLEDPAVPRDKRRLPLVILAVASAHLGRRAQAEEAIRQFKTLPGPPTMTLCGTEVDPAAHVADVLKRHGHTPASWCNVGGTAARAAVAQAGLGVQGVLPFARAEAPPRVLPDKARLLGDDPAQGGCFTEGVALATDRTVLVAAGDRLVAFDRTTGSERWRGPPVPTALLGWPSCGDGHVAATLVVGPGPDDDAAMRRYVASQPRRIVVLSEDTGRLLWWWPSEVDAKWLAVLNAARAQNGQEPLSADDLPGPAGPGPAGAELEPVGSPLVYGGRVFVGAARGPRRSLLVDCSLMCFDVRTGELLWKRFVGSGGLGRLGAAGLTLDRMIPTTDGRRVYVESAVETVAAIDLDTVSVAWIRSFDRPRPRRGSFVDATNWSAEITDAPMVVGDRLYVTDVFGPKLRCLDTADGRTLWEVRAPAAWRLGVHGGLLLFAAQFTLVGYDLETGAERLRVELPAEVTHRGFAAEDAAYVPTTHGVLRVALPDVTVSAMTEPGGSVTVSRALAPVGRLILSSGDDGVKLLGPMPDLLAEARRALAANPESPVCHLRLGNLARQQKSFAMAERHLLAAAKRADAMAARDGDGLPEQVRRETAEQIVLLYRDWAADLRRRGKTEEAMARLNRCMEMARSHADTLSARMALAEHYESLGNRGRAEACYAEVAADEVSRRALWPTGAFGLRRTLAAEAELGLRRLQGGAAAPPGAAGLRSTDVERLAVSEIAMLSWKSPSYVVCDARDDFAPVLWVRPDGLAALGADGDVRWTCLGTSESAGRPAWVRANGAVAVARHRGGIAVHDLHSGALRWRWQPGPGRTLSTTPTATQLVHVRAFRRAQGGAVAALLPEPPALPGEKTPNLLLAGTRVVVLSHSGDGRDQVLHGLDVSTGRQQWSAALPDGLRVRGTETEAGKVAVVAHAADGRFLVLCLDERTGAEQWRREDTIPRARKLSWLFRGGLFVMNDSTGQCTVVQAADGVPRWQRRIDGRWSPGAVPFAADGDRILLQSDHGLMAVSAGDGRVLWRTVVDGEAPWLSTPIAAGQLLVTSAGGEVAALDVGTGRQRWRRKVEDAGDGGLALVVSGDVVISCGRSPAAPKAVFLRLADGSPVGEVSLGDEPGPTDISPLRRGVCVQCGDRVVAVAAPALLAREDEGDGAAHAQDTPEERADVHEAPQAPKEPGDAPKVPKERAEEKP